MLRRSPLVVAEPGGEDDEREHLSEAGVAASACELRVALVAPAHAAADDDLLADVVGAQFFRVMRAMSVEPHAGQTASSEARRPELWCVSRCTIAPLYREGGRGSVSRRRVAAIAVAKCMTPYLNERESPAEGGPTAASARESARHRKTPSAFERAGVLLSPSRARRGLSRKREPSPECGRAGRVSRGRG